MNHLQSVLTRALADDRTQASFATLDKHKASGRFNRDEALRLLRRNARDHTKHTPGDVRDRVALALYAAWMESRA